MKGWGVRIQVGRTTITPRWEHPEFWFSRSLMAPKLYGLGFYITHDLWANR